jgi:hypothetical protein
MQTTPGGPRRRTRVARALGLDRNPLRRASDRAEAWIRIGLLAVFLIAGPMAALTAGGWAYHAAVTGHREHAAPTRIEIATPHSALETTYLGPADRARAETWLPNSAFSTRGDEALAAIMSLAVTALVLLAVLRLSLAILRRRNLAAWETAWSRVGPQWSRRKP